MFFLRDGVNRVDLEEFWVYNVFFNRGCIFLFIKWNILMCWFGFGLEWGNVYGSVLEIERYCFNSNLLIMSKLVLFCKNRGL